MVISPAEYFLLFFATMLLVGFLTPVMGRLALSKNVLDYPDSIHKTHSQPVPYLGGIAILLGVVLITYLAILLSDFNSKVFWLASSLLGPAVAMGLIGLWDDIKKLPPLPRFVGQTIAATVIAVTLVLNNNLGNPTGLMYFDVFVTILWIVGICNSINFFDNVDGGAAGTTVVSTCALTVITIFNGQTLIASLSLVVSGATLGFLIWNKPPAKIYMGDAGALFLGVILAILTIRLRPDSDSTLISFLVPILLVAVPILDTSVAVISRLRRKISPFRGGKDHLSHRLIRSGISRKIAVVLLWSLSVLFALFALIINFVNSKIGLQICSIAILIWIFLFFYFIFSADE